MSGRRITVSDAVFLASESRESMMHVGALMPFTAPPDAEPTFLRDLMEELRESPHAFPPWNKRLKNPEFLASPRQKWITDDDFDLDYHVRRSALPIPGGERELGILVSRLHSVQMDFHRPLWEVHLIEGLHGGRFAMYAKVHHSLIDGYTAMQILSNSLSPDPDERDMPLFFHRERPKKKSAGEPVATLSGLLDLVREQIDGSAPFWKAVGRLGKSWGGLDPHLAAPMQSPSTIFNKKISRNRRFATQSYAQQRLKDVAKASGGTLNDVALCLCGSALRRLLIDLNALPDAPLTAMLPVNIRPADDPGGGNAVGAILASLATNIADPQDRLAEIIASTRRAKKQLEGMPRSTILQYTALLLAPLAGQLATGTAGIVRPAFNVVISNVPGPSQPLYFRGARLEGAYPLSIPFHGYGLNITLNGYAGDLNFGFIGCRDALPHLQRLAVYAGEALEELEAAVG
ncbi:MAG: wax ester/triacylglycerol synthase family O-acyltransferase [Deltaproteobacteria bacterium]|nr:MAG: wax ester/triacylglycerol synthase family O-acyltransferase [Deltaproteobacteria bacterium]